MAATKRPVERVLTDGHEGSDPQSTRISDGISADGFVGTEPALPPRLEGFAEYLERDAHESVSNEESSEPLGPAEPADGETEFPVSAAKMAALRGTAGEKQQESELLDAWYASFASPLTRALLLKQRRDGGDLTEVVIGADDRQRITATNQYPWRAICSLLITASDGSRWIGTGWFAGPRLVVTAGHCVFMRDNGGWARSIEVIPGRNGTVRPYGARTSNTFRSVTGWTQQNNRDFDYGAIVISGGTAIGSQTGYFGLAVKTDAQLLQNTVNISGYPGDKAVGTQWWHARGIDRVTAKTFFYQIDTAGGQSGAPVWLLQNNERRAVGIHTNGSPSGNSATRINQAVFDNLVRWKNEAGE